MVQFVIGTPVDRAMNDVRNAVSQIRSDLPDGILEPQVTRIDIDGGPIAYWSVEATDMTLEQLSWFVDDTVARRLLAVEGMASVSRNGGVNREIRVILDPARMQSLGVTASQINGVLRQQNLNAAGGQSEISVHALSAREARSGSDGSGDGVLALRCFRSGGEPPPHPKGRPPEVDGEIT